MINSIFLIKIIHTSYYYLKYEYVIISNYLILLFRIMYICYYLIMKKHIIDKASMLYLSIKFHYHDVTKFMLDIHTSPEIKHPSPNKRSTTPLIYSIDYNNHVATEFLLSYGANVDRTIGESKVTPVYLSVLYTSPKCLDILLRYYPDINMQIDGITSLELALMICCSYTSNVIKNNDKTLLNRGNKYYINLNILESLVSYFMLYETHKRNKNTYGYFKNKSLITGSVFLKRIRDLCNSDIENMKSIIIESHSGSLLSFFDVFINNDVDTLLNHLDNKFIVKLPEFLNVYNNEVRRFIKQVKDMVQ
ncbi:SWPV1-267 [Shearwaterpox virus]|uniref:SWPV1-267 n=1 Tax=Shearwaterpox virus TaxID=1974596 RepID=A0A1V0S875_CNPV|nr:SWPV1-267 [Shearwaterpox virus]